MSKRLYDFTKFKGAMDVRRIIAKAGDFMVFEKDGKFFVATIRYPSGGPLPGGSYAEEFSSEGEARRYMKELYEGYPP